MVAIPHPIPYQGSKRRLCVKIAACMQPARVLYEPFAGSAAFSLYAAAHGLVQRFIIGDMMEPLIALWHMIVEQPTLVATRYETLWSGQQPDDASYYNRVRDEYNASSDPVALLYLITRCVKNAVRFSQHGRFTQSQDRRRLGMHPRKMSNAVHQASRLLKGRVRFVVGDFADCLRDAAPGDLVYLDPPYQGTTYGRDKRYFAQLKTDRLIDVLHDLNARGIAYALSYDGLHGEKTYGSELPSSLGLHRLLLNGGRSAQATLNGHAITTYEALYLSPALQHIRSYSSPDAAPLDAAPVQLTFGL